ncbi:MAG: hypothetical protein JSV42_16800 [Chloroflexota bacterium]|nr:MAG: hypothetical protein JSV42_16800 [Chloroflexota bacterium]
MRIDKEFEVDHNHNSEDLISWLLAGDPAIRFQVMRDLLSEAPENMEEEREKITLLGWGKRYLSYQDSNGLWAGGIYGPKWISTTYTMLTLKRLGLPSYNQQAQEGCRQLLDRGFFRDLGINYSKSQQQSEVCITGMVLSVLAHFKFPDPRVHKLADHLLSRQMQDGGWNCQDHQGDRHSSFHTTISVLEGLLEYQRAYGQIRPDIESARLKGHEFLLQHRLYKSDHTGAIVSERMLRMPFPPRWFYDFLRALDYFQDYFTWQAQSEIQFPDRQSEQLAATHIRDERFSDAIELLKNKRKPDGRWRMMRGPSGKVYFDMEKAGGPSRWNTLRALRVLKWWEGVN